jgi:hypothetical protein
MGCLVKLMALQHLVKVTNGLMKIGQNPKYEKKIFFNDKNRQYI